ncbi:MAG: aspartate kinase [Puniceicoccales bacterium]|jgi:aspartate kinase|nr:aspartate kinase [Puniceicoccales bacterium]
MPLIVQKYGGTSLQDFDRIQQVAERIRDTHHQGHPLIVVISAQGGVTDQLIRDAEACSASPSAREVDALLATGEQACCCLVTLALQALGVAAISLSGEQAGIWTDKLHRHATIQDIQPDRIHRHLKEGKVVLVSGCQGISPEGDITTFGRGGSDLTAIALAACFHADRCEIFTDVDGVYAADPRRTPLKECLQQISFDTMLAVSQNGGKVMHSRSVALAKEKNVSFHVRSSFAAADNEGTLISSPPISDWETIHLSVKSNLRHLRFSLAPSSLPEVYGEIHQLNACGTCVDWFSERALANGHEEICVTFETGKEEHLLRLKKVIAQSGGELCMEGYLSRISLIGALVKENRALLLMEWSRELNASQISIVKITANDIHLALFVHASDTTKATAILSQKLGLEKSDPS